jgi:glycosyltransferase involved in cell wall biosynthesis
MRLGIGEDEYAIGCIGAIRDKKNQLELIQRTAPALANLLPNMRLHFFGDFAPDSDPYAQRCLASVRDLGLESQVVFHGHTADIAEATRVLDCIVIGARHEGLARCMIEGMACGIPVVSFAVCSAREMLVDTGAGRVVTLGDHIGLVEALADVARDRPERTLMGHRGRTAAQVLFDVNRIRASYQALYDEVMQ